MINHIAETNKTQRTVKEQMFYKSTHREPLRLERVQMETATLHNKVIDSSIEYVVQRADTTARQCRQCHYSQPKQKQLSHESHARNHEQRDKVMVEMDKIEEMDKSITSEVDEIDLKAVATSVQGQLITNTNKTS